MKKKQKTSISEEDSEMNLFCEDDLEEPVKMTYEEEKAARRAARLPKQVPPKPNYWSSIIAECPNGFSAAEHANKIHIRGHKDIPHGCKTWGDLPRRVDCGVLCIEWRPLKPCERPTVAWSMVAYTGEHGVKEPVFPRTQYMNFEIK